mmetsp:Transcript_113710/g.361292  ORF Transcript_113710/g.361292 Transcript_113710/m.361292 type:complete len:242 (+) Transcript_113710:502-1227(+)
MVVVHSKCDDYADHPIVLQLPAWCKCRVEPQPPRAFRFEEQARLRREKLPGQDTEELAHYTTFINSLFADELNAQGPPKIHGAGAVHLRESFPEKILAVHPQHEVEGRRVHAAPSEQRFGLGPQDLLLGKPLPEDIFNLQHPLLEGHRHQIRVCHEGAEAPRQHARNIRPPRLVDHFRRGYLAELRMLLEEPKLHFWWDVTFCKRGELKRGSIQEAHHARGPHKHGASRRHRIAQPAGRRS